MINQNKMTAVEQLIAEIEQELQDREGCNGALNSGAVLGLTNAKNIAHKYLEMEKENLIDMSVKSALHERKWLYENMSGKEYKAEKIEIRNLQETALEHYNIAFKSE